METFAENVKLEIARVFGNRANEKHPLKRGSSGMEWFAKLKRLTAQLSAEEVEQFLVPLINEMLRRQSACLACYAKLCAFAEVFCAMSPVHAEHYGCLLDDRVATDGSSAVPPRDFRREVRGAIARYAGKPYTGMYVTDVP
jgi:hypothetical protein